jgi:hypothetical protein
MAGISETIEHRRGEVLTLREVVDILKAHGHGKQALYALCDELGVLLDEPYGEGEVIYWEQLFEFLGY